MDFRLRLEHAVQVRAAACLLLLVCVAGWTTSGLQAAATLLDVPVATRYE